MSKKISYSNKILIDYDILFVDSEWKILIVFNNKKYSLRLSTLIEDNIIVDELNSLSNREADLKNDEYSEKRLNELLYELSKIIQKECFKIFEKIIKKEVK